MAGGGKVQELKKGQRRERRESSDMVGGFGRPRDQDERDGGEEHDHHHHHHQR